MGLTPLQVKHAKDGVLFDGEGLYLRVSGGGTRKSWVLRFTLYGKRIDLGLGSAKLLSLGEARDEARRLRKMALLGQDPRLDARFVQPVEVTPEPVASPAPVPVIAPEPVSAPGAPEIEAGEEAQGLTFAEAVDEYLKIQLQEFKNAKHIQQWQNTLRTYACAPEGIKGLGKMPVADITKHDVLRVLKPIWNTKTETASRVRGRIENVLKWATAADHRTGENPARWESNLEKLLPKPAKIKNVKHHEALPYKNLPAFITDLTGRDSVSARALEFLIFTGVRSTVAREVPWAELDLEARLWTIPKERTKTEVAQRVPLPAQMIALLEKMKGLNDTYVFAIGPKSGPVTETALRKLVQETMKHPDLTLHGFRTTFRTWMQDAGTEWEVAETILSHKVGNAVSQAYAREDYLERRKPVMQAYADFAFNKPAN